MCMCSYPDSRDSKFCEFIVSFIPSTHLAVLNKYRKRRIHNTANLLTGEADVAPGSMKVAQGDTVTEADIISYYHPNITICLVEDYTKWVKGSVPQPLDNCKLIKYCSCARSIC